MKAAWFEVTLDLLASALRLPEGATIRRISGDEAQQTIRRTVMVLVEGAPGMPDVPEGAYPPSVRPDVDDEGNLIWE